MLSKIMSNLTLFIIIAAIGYLGLWILGSLLFLFYFKLFKVSIDLKHVVNMIRKLPATISILTVPTCSFISFFFVTKMSLGILVLSVNTTEIIQLDFICLLITIILDLLITVFGEKVDIRIYPVNLIYVLAWLAIIPAVFLGAR